MPSLLDNDRAAIARHVRALRTARKWTQAELARRLGLSQNRLSEIERGDGSFSAEQFLEILRLFNVTLNDFVPTDDTGDQALQNALARLGARHLRESSDVLPSERLREVDSVLREVLISAESPRLVTALAPVLVQNLEQVKLAKLQARLAEAGLDARLGWLVENTLEAIHQDAATADRAWKRMYRRAEVVLGAYLSRAQPAASKRNDAPHAFDLLDPSIRSSKTLADVLEGASSISRRWSIATTVQPEDFTEALRGAHV